MAWGFITTFLALVLVATPGFLIYLALFQDEDTDLCVIQGFTWGIMQDIITLYVAVNLNWNIFWVIWAAALGVGAFLTLKTARAGRRRVELKSLWLLLTVLGLVAVTRLGVAVIHSVPVGDFDPKMHLAIALKAARTRHIFTTWEPLDPAVLTYPLGMHFFLVLLSDIARCPLHVVYNFLMQFLGILTTALVYVFARKTIRDKEAAVAAAFIYGMIAVYGSIGYYIWGGLPNELGMCFMIFALNLIPVEKWGFRHVVIFALSFLAIFFTHHHVMIVTGVLYLVILMVFSVTKEYRSRALKMVYAGVISLLVGGVFIIPYALRVFQIQQTDVLRFYEPFFGIHRIFTSLGYVFTIIVVIGLPAWFFVQKDLRPDRRSSRVLFTVIGTLLALFVCCGYIYRIYAKMKYGVDYVAFTPSRFLTDAVPFLAVSSASIILLWKKWKFSYFGLCLILLFGAGMNYPTWRELWQKPDPPPAIINAYKFIAENTPERTVVLTNDLWAPYWTERRTMRTPLSISDIRKGTPKYRVEIERKLHDPSYKWPKPFYLVAVGYPSQFKIPIRILHQDPSGLAVVHVIPEPKSDK